MSLCERDLSPPVASISGASGYLGQALIRRLREQGGHEVHALSNSSSKHKQMEDVFSGEVTFASLLEPESLGVWPSRQSSVIHLAYMWDAPAEVNLQATRNLVQACGHADIRRLIQVSTAAVIGRSSLDWVDEQTPCQPVTEYGSTKLEIERIVREGAREHGFDCVILRPTSVYGPAGAPLRKLLDDLQHAPWLKNYLKACLFGRRAMNLVHVDNVVAAMLFLLRHPGRFDGATFFLSEDAAPGNNFIDVERLARSELGLGAYPLPVLPLPGALLSALLRILGRNIVNPECRFRSDQIEAAGHENVHSLQDGLIDYLAWYREAYIPAQPAAPERGE